MKIDRESLQDAINEITDAYEKNENLCPINPVLIYNDKTGEFSIESALVTEEHICFHLEHIDGLTSAISVLGGADTNILSDNYIKEHIIGI